MQGDAAVKVKAIYLGALSEIEKRTNRAILFD